MMHNGRVMIPKPKPRMPKPIHLHKYYATRHKTFTIWNSRSQQDTHAHKGCNVPKSDMHANPKNDMHENPKSDMQTLKVTCMTSKHYLMMHALN